MEKSLEETKNSKTDSAIGCRGCLLSILTILIVIFLTALFWPVSKEKIQAERRSIKPSFIVEKIKVTVATDIAVSSGGNSRFHVVSFDFRNGRGRLPLLDYVNFTLIVRQGGLYREYTAHPSTPNIYGKDEEMPWGNTIAGGKVLRMKALFLLPNGSYPVAMRVYDASWLSSKFTHHALITEGRSPTLPLSRVL